MEERHKPVMVSVIFLNVDEMKITLFETRNNAWDESFVFEGLGDEFSFYTEGTILFFDDSHEVECSVFLLEYYKELNRLLTRTLGLKSFQCELVMQLSGAVLQLQKNPDMMSVKFQSGVSVEYSSADFYKFYFELKRALAKELLTVYPSLKKTFEFNFLFDANGI